MFKIWTIGIVTVLAVVVRADAPLAKSSSPKTKESMSNFLDQFIGLKRYLVSDAEFLDQKNAPVISNYLKELAQAVKKTNHDPILYQENFKFSRDVLEDHVVETERVFRLGNKSYARWMTNSTLGICMSCHTQLPTQSRQFAVLTKFNTFTSDFDQAEFMFATKNFEGANRIYEDLVANFPKNGVSPAQLEKCIQRVMLYFIRVKRDFEAAQSTIKSFKKNKQLPEFLSQNLHAWGEQLTKWQKKKLPDVSKGKASEILNFAETNLSIDENLSRIDSSDPRYISNLVVSGVLYDFLQKNPSSAFVPDVLYWLAVIDRELSRSPFYSLADLYLKECILKFPENKTAMKCYKEYEAEMVFGYTGSGGTNVPREVLEDLKYLKKYVESKGKLPLQRSAP